jgi:uncharacterized protein YwgA
MDSNLTVLKLFLEELGINPEIRNIDDRKKLQKAVYLGQQSGVDLGYRYGWYLMGPYSPALTQDYFALNTEIQSEDDTIDKKLKPSVREKLANIKEMVDKYKAIDLNISDWLELLASYHFLSKVRNYNHEQTEEKLRNEKPKLAEYSNHAEKALKEYGLI